MRSIVLRLMPQVLLIMLVLGVISPPLSAHAVLVSSSPRNNAVVKIAPKQAVLRFDARIEKRVTQVSLFDSSGRKVALPSGSHGNAGGPADRLVIPLPKLRPGSYKLQYQVMATDGHLTPGRIRFTVSGGKAP